MFDLAACAERALDEFGDRGTVGLEAWASGDSEQALSRFRETFTGPLLAEPDP